MPANTEAQPYSDEATLMARGLIASSLAAAWIDPATQGPSKPTPDAQLMRAAWSVLAGTMGSEAPGDLGLGELLPDRVDIESLCAWLQTPDAIRADALQATFGLVVSRDCPLYESEYIPSRDVSTRSQHLADLAGFFGAFGLKPWPSRPGRPDHLSVIISFTGVLADKQSAARQESDRSVGLQHEQVCQDAASTFMRDHVCWWVPTFARLCEQRIQRVLVENGWTLTDDPSRAPSATSSLDPTAEHLRRTVASMRKLSGIARIVRAWVAIERVHCGVEPIRRIVQPDVATPDVEDVESCGDCSIGCAEQSGAPAQ